MLQLDDCRRLTANLTRVPKDGCIVSTACSGNCNENDECAHSVSCFLKFGLCNLSLLTWEWRFETFTLDTWGQKLDDGDRLCLENSLQLGSRLIQICIPFMRRGRLLEMGINLTEWTTNRPPLQALLWRENVARECDSYLWASQGEVREQIQKLQRPDYKKHSVHTLPESPKFIVSTCRQSTVESIARWSSEFYSSPIRLEVGFMRKKFLC